MASCISLASESRTAYVASYTFRALSSLSLPLFSVNQEPVRVAHVSTCSALFHVYSSIPFPRGQSLPVPMLLGSFLPALVSLFAHICFEIIDDGSRWGGEKGKKKNIVCLVGTWGNEMPFELQKCMDSNAHNY